MSRIDLTNAMRQARHRQRPAAALQQAWSAKGMPGSPVLNAIPGTVRWRALIANALSSLQLCHKEMADYYDERSEEWQESERGESMQERIEALEQLLDELSQVSS